MANNGTIVVLFPLSPCHNLPPPPQIHKYTNTQIHKYTNTQIHKFIHKYKCPNTDGEQCMARLWYCAMLEKGNIAITIYHLIKISVRWSTPVVFCCVFDGNLPLTISNQHNLNWLSGREGVGFDRNLPAAPQAQALAQAALQALAQAAPQEHQFGIQRRHTGGHVWYIFRQSDCLIRSRPKVNYSGASNYWFSDALVASLLHLYY